MRILKHFESASAGCAVMDPIGIDTGGTFTDLVFRTAHGWQAVKVPSTPDDPAAAMQTGLAHTSDLQGPIIHGTTVATNALLEHRAAPTALITNRGFEDLIEIGRQQRRELYNLACAPGPCLVPRALRFGISGRILSDGSEHEPLQPAEWDAIIAAIRDHGVTTVAVALLFSFVNPTHEQAIGQRLQQAGLHVSLSHLILAEFREYERTSTTVVNAALRPVMHSYLERLATGIDRHSSLAIMQSSGSAIEASTASEEPARTILSGPAGGVIGAAKIARHAGFDQVITFDMGGTSTDVCLVHDAPAMVYATTIGDQTVALPAVDIHTIGAGGGSLARATTAGTIAVGPQSAGARPGPACYGQGSGLTVTDANLWLGRLPPDRFLGGTMHLHPERLQPLLSDLGNTVGLAPDELAAGILDLANAAMERAIRRISVERGHDPAACTLVSFGGAGAMHAAFLARSLKIPRVLVPPLAGLLSACGMILADTARDYSQTVMIPADDAAHACIDRVVGQLRQRAAQTLGDVACSCLLDMRYRGQSHELSVPRQPDLRAAFDRAHHQRYGHSLPGQPIEIVTIRLRAAIAGPAAGLFSTPLPSATADPQPDAATRAWFAGHWHATPIYRREMLHPAHTVTGPAIVTEYSTTLVVPPGDRVSVDPHNNLLLTLAPEQT